MNEFKEYLRENGYYVVDTMLGFTANKQFGGYSVTLVNHQEISPDKIQYSTLVCDFEHGQFSTDLDLNIDLDSFKQFEKIFFELSNMLVKANLPCIDFTS